MLHIFFIVSKVRVCLSIPALRFPRSLLTQISKNKESYIFQIWLNVNFCCLLDQCFPIFIFFDFFVFEFFRFVRSPPSRTTKNNLPPPRKIRKARARYFRKEHNITLNVWNFTNLTKPKFSKMNKSISFFVVVLFVFDGFNQVFLILFVRNWRLARVLASVSPVATPTIVFQEI